MVLGAVVVGLAGAIAFGGWAGGSTAPDGARDRPPLAPAGTSSTITSSTTTSSTTTSSTTTTTATAPPAAAAPAPVALVPAVPGGAFAVGDSVLVDAQGALAAAVPGIEVDAAVSRQWGEGEPLVAAARARGITGTVVVFLGTNGPIAASDVDAMMAAAQGVQRVVFVTVHVDQPWQDPNNAVLAAGVARYPNAVLADWYALSTPHPEWFYSDGTHLPIGGPGARALAALIASKVG